MSRNEILLMFGLASCGLHETSRWVALTNVALYDFFPNFKIDIFFREKIKDHSLKSFSKIEKH